MRRRLVFWLPVLLILFFLISVAVAAAYSWEFVSFENKGSAKSMKMKIPKITLSAAEETKLYEGKAITRLLDAPNGLKYGYLRFFTPFDPVTAWMVVTNADHFDLVDPSYPKSGSLLDKRRTFMPYCFDVATCVEQGRPRMYQLLVMPLVAPRKLCIDRYHNTDGFPFETYWKQTDAMCCQDQTDPELSAKYFDKAVTLKRNIGAWHISPLPAKFIKTEKDKMRADLIYYVDTHPGGDIGKLKPLVNKAQSIALPALMENVLFHGPVWEDYLKKHRSAELLAKYKTWLADYKQSVGVQ